MKLNKKLVFSLLGIVLLVGVSVYLISLMGNDEVTNEKMELKFESRVNKIESFDSGEYTTVGWLQVQGTNIDVPILDYRASSEDEEISYSYGWRSVNYVTGQNREVLAGHNILNVSSKPMLPDKNLSDFEELMAFSYYGFAKDNMYVQYTKDGVESIYVIYAIGFYDYDTDEAESISDSKKIKEYIRETKNNSIYDYSVDVNENDTLLSIKTCTRYFGLFEKQQFILNLRRVRDGEEIVKYKVSTNSNFDKLINSQENS